MATAIPENIAAITSRADIIDAVFDWSRNFDDGTDEITLSREGTIARIVICTGTFPSGSDGPLRDSVKQLDSALRISISRGGNYGRFPAAHDPMEWAAFQR